MADNELYNVKDVVDYQVHQVLYRSPLPYKDLYQIGYEGYLKAVKNYNPIYGKMTLGYASTYISQAIRRAVNKEYKHNKHVNSNHEEEYLTSLIEKHGEQSEPNPTAAPELKLIEEKLEELTPTERNIVYDLFLSKKIKRIVDLSEEFGVSKQRIFQIKEEALAKLRTMLKDDEEIE